MEDKDFDQIAFNYIQVRKYQTDFRILRHILSDIFDQILNRLLTVLLLQIRLNLFSIFLKILHPPDLLHSKDDFRLQVLVLELIITVHCQLEIFVFAELWAFFVVVIFHHLFGAYFLLNVGN